MISMTYDVGKRNKLEIINILEKNGTINKNGIKEFIGLDRFEARKTFNKKT
jgi:valyl-tRNA synthetase